MHRCCMNGIARSGMLIQRAGRTAAWLPALKGLHLSAGIARLGGPSPEAQRLIWQLQFIKSPGSCHTDPHIARLRCLAWTASLSVWAPVMGMGCTRQSLTDTDEGGHTSLHMSLRLCLCRSMCAYTTVLMPIGHGHDAELYPVNSRALHMPTRFCGACRGEHLQLAG